MIAEQRSHMFYRRLPRTWLAAHSSVLVATCLLQSARSRLLQYGVPNFVAVHLCCAKLRTDNTGWTQHAIALLTDRGTFWEGALLCACEESHWSDGQQVFLACQFTIPRFWHINWYYIYQLQLFFAIDDTTCKIFLLLMNSVSFLCYCSRCPATSPYRHHCDFVRTAQQLQFFIASRHCVNSVKRIALNRKLSYCLSLKHV